MHGPAIFRRCRQLLGDDDAAHDAVQEVFLRMLGRGPSFRGGSSPLTWLYAVATNHCLQQLRNARLRERKLGALADPNPAWSGAGAEDRLLWQAILGEQDESTQRVALLRHVDGFTLEEVAQLVGLSRKTVARKLDRFAASAQHKLTLEEPP